MNADQVHYYAERAREYEKIYMRPERQDEIVQIKELLKKEFNGLNVFEVACGTGFWTQAISESANSILATDINQSVIDVAREKEFGSANVEFQIMNMFEIEPNQLKFNGGFGGTIWSHIPKQDFNFFLEHFLSKIEAGGKVIFLDNIYVEGHSTPIATEDKEENTYQVRTLNDGSQYVVMKNFPSDLEIRSMLSDVAENLKITRFTDFWVASFNKKG